MAAPAGAVLARTSPQRSRTMLEETGLVNFTARVSGGEAAAGAEVLAPASTCSLRDLHRRWATLRAERWSLHSYVDDEMMSQRHRSTPFISIEEGCVFSESQIDGVLDARPVRSDEHRAEIDAQRISYKTALAVDAADFEKVARELDLMPEVHRIREIDILVDELLDRLYEAPIGGIEDLAILLDVACDTEIDGFGEALAPEEIPDRIPFVSKLFQAFAQLAPGVEFTSGRLHLLPDQFDALMGRRAAA
jgi:hypothetical protein